MVEENDCLSCRLISGFGCIAIGSYVYYQGKKTRSFQKLGFSIIASSFVLAGVARLFNLGPFQRNSQQSAAVNISSGEI